MKWPWSREPQELIAAAAPRLEATASVGQIGDPRMAPSLRRKAQQWQAEAWDHVDTIGPLGSAVDYVANACSKVRVFPAVVLAPDEPPVPIDVADGVPTQVVDSALASWALYRDTDGGQSELIRKHAKHFLVPGETYLVGRESSVGDPLGAEQWEIRSVDEVRVGPDITGGFPTIEVRDSPQSRWQRLPEGAYVARMWQKHDRFRALADSPLRRLIPDCDEFVMHAFAVMGETRSRVPAGLVLWPEGLTVVGPEGALASSADAPQRVMDAMMTAVRDPGDGSALVPTFVIGNHEALKELRHLLMSRSTTTDSAGQRDAALKRLAQGGPWPPEVFLGLGETNHWNARAIINAVYDQYMDPLMITVTSSAAAAYLRPRMLSDAQDPYWVARTVLDVDASSVTSDPTQAEHAQKAHEALVISDATYRKALDFDEEDAPEPEEYARRAEVKARAGFGAAPPGIGPSSPITASAAAGLRQIVLTTAGRRRPSPMTTARLLAGINAGLAERLRLASDAEVARTVDRAGAKTRSRLSRDRVAAAAIAAVPNRLVVATLGRAVVAAAVDEAELVEESWERLQGRYRTWTATAREQALRAVAAATGAEFSDLDEDTADAFTEARDESWAWLAAALTGLALARLYEPDPQVGPGEADPTVSVPRSMVRETLARAGGETVERQGTALLAAGAERPLTGLANGPLVADVFAEFGQVVSSWAWDYGDPSSRATTFQPHYLLDGEQFDTWSDDVLANNGDFPDVAFVFPGDHDGCACDVVAVFAPAEAVAASVRPARQR